MPNYFDTLPSPLKTANFHYFRIAHEKWALMLIRLAQLGFDTVSVPVSWSFHQLTPATIDITGITNTRRNLVDLVALCQMLNLRCVLNLGPYSRNQAMLGNGLPHWVSDTPETLPPAARQWFQTLGQVLTSAQWPQGPIIALQLDTNEGATPSYPPQLTTVTWPIWLRKRYKGVDALNAAYGANYHSVSDVAFPEKPGDIASPLDKDVQAFLAEHLDAFQSGYTQTLTEAGWHVPIYTTSTSVATLPNEDAAWFTTPDVPLLTLSAPIQVNPDPPDIATGLVWAAEAPIRADGWLRKQFWVLRQTLWAELWPAHTLEDTLFTVVVDGGGIISAAQDTPVKLLLPKGYKPAVYRLRVTGEVVSEAGFSVNRGRLIGHYGVEDKGGQTDFIFYLEKPAAPLNPFLASYLSRLLLAQANTLQECAKLATEIGQLLTIDPMDTPQPPAAAKTKSTPYTIAEARRGLNEAEAALKKAVASIGGLESGFGTIIGKRSGAEPAMESVKISPEIFEGNARQLLLAAGKQCAQLAPSLQAAAKTILAATTMDVDTTSSLTLGMYQHNYVVAITAARNASLLLLETIAQLRQEIATEQLPLVTWQVHNQIQAIVEGLCWGVERR